MKKLKTLITILCTLSLIPLTVYAESSLNKDFPLFGIKNIGIFIEGYEDERTENFSKSYIEAFKNNDFKEFKTNLCNYHKITPLLMSPFYPLSSGDNDLNNQIYQATNTYLKSLGWQTLPLELHEGHLKKLLNTAKHNNLDAVLVLRYFKVEDFIRMEGYERDTNFYGDSKTIEQSALFGPPIQGLALFPTFELYDTATGARLWYSAYHTIKANSSEKYGFQASSDAAAEFFIEGEAPIEEAIDKMLELTIKADQFPEASFSAVRKNSKANSYSTVLSDIFWNQHSAFDGYGSLFAISYLADYSETADIVKASFFGPQSDEFEYSIDTINHFLLHKAVLPFSIATRNIVFDGGIYLGFSPTYTSTFTYTVEDDPATISNMSVSFFSWGFEAQLKYLIRLTDTFSLYLGARGVADLLYPIVDYDVDIEKNINIEDTMLLRYGIITGFRWDLEKPIELFAAYMPAVNLAGYTTSSTVSAGLIWHAYPMFPNRPHDKSYY